MNCSNCGSPVPEGTRFCLNCGAALSAGASNAGANPAGPNTSASRKTAPPRMEPFVLSGPAAAPAYHAAAPTDGRFGSAPGIRILRSLAASPKYLVAAVTYTLSILLGLYVAATSISSMLYRFSDLMYSYGASEADIAQMQDALQEYASQVDQMGLVTGLIFNIPALLTALGLWLIFAAGRKNEDREFSTTGLTIIQFISLLEFIFSCAIFVLSLLVLLPLASELLYYFNEADENPMGYIILIALVIIIPAVLLLIYLFKIFRMVSGAKEMARTGKPVQKASVYVGVLLMLSVLPSLISLLFSPGLGKLQVLCSIISTICFGMLIFSCRRQTEDALLDRETDLYAGAPASGTPSGSAPAPGKAPASGTGSALTPYAGAPAPAAASPASPYRSTPAPAAASPASPYRSTPTPAAAPASPYSTAPAPAAAPASPYSTAPASPYRSAPAPAAAPASPYSSAPASAAAPASPYRSAPAPAAAPASPYRSAPASAAAPASPYSSAPARAAAPGYSSMTDGNPSVSFTASGPSSKLKGSLLDSLQNNSRNTANNPAAPAGSRLKGSLLKAEAEQKPASAGTPAPARPAAAARAASAPSAAPAASSAADKASVNRAAAPARDALPSPAPVRSAAAAAAPAPAGKGFPVPDKIADFDSTFSPDTVYASPCETSLLEESTLRQAPALLVRMRDRTEKSVNVPLLRLGRSSSLSDYVIDGNPAVGRHHADIVFHNGSYCIIDKSSVNHVYVNGQIIPPETEIPLSDRSEIRLADEVFLFRTN